MRQSLNYNFPNLAKQFRNEKELASLIFQEYTGLTREYLLARRV